MADIKEIEISAYFRNQSDIAAVYLFGSYARGQQRPTSDLDLGLLFKHPDRNQAAAAVERHYLALSRLLRKTPHLVVMNFAGEMMLKQIFTKGRCLIVNQPRIHAKFKMTAYTRIADFAYYHAMFERGFIKKMDRSANG